MKWANRDINIVEWANIPKFSALDDLVTPSDFSNYSLRRVVDKIFGYIKLYSRENRH